MRRAWGKVHLMRSGKRADMDWIDDLDQDVAVDENSEHLGLEDKDLGIDLNALDNNKLRRTSRSGFGRIKQQAQKQKMNRVQNIWGWDLLIDKRAGLAKFGGGHMLRSGKRSSQDNEDQDTRQHNAFYIV